MKNLKLLMVLFFVMGAEVSNAQTLAPATLAASTETAQAVKSVPRARPTENLLDFEAEVIEGEKKRPELFLDIKAGDGNVGSGLYLRPNFDDFFSVDKKRRPRFVKSK